MFHLSAAGPCQEGFLKNVLEGEHVLSALVRGLGLNIHRAESLYWLNCIPPPNNSYAEIPQSVTIFGEKAFKEVIK